MKDVLDVDITTPLPRLTYNDAMSRYGSDKPDTRFGMEIQDLSDIVKDTEFSVFSSAIAAGGSVRAIVAKNAAGVLTRKEIDKLTEFSKESVQRVLHISVGMMTHLTARLQSSLKKASLTLYFRTSAVKRRCSAYRCGQEQGYAPCTRRSAS